jgi:GNAT superfamily N-acetyltransferase
MNEINIRKATVQDVVVIHRLLSELEKTLGATTKINREVEDLTRFGFSDEPCFHALIAWADNEAVGLVLFFKEFSTWKGAVGVYVQDLYVSPVARGTGLGRELMKAAYEQARSWDASYCKLTVHDGNETALAFYERLGFRTIMNETVLILDEL